MARPLEVTFVSHACLKISGEFGTLLCDPWFLNEPVYNLSTWKFPAAVIPPDELVSGVDYLFISHSHEDHFHIPSIDHIDRNVTVLLPAYESHPSLRAHTTERMMRELGFHRIKRVKGWETVMLGGVTPFTFIPAADTRQHDWENAGFVLAHPDATILNLNDNVNDAALCQEIKRRWPVIDLALVQAGGVTMFPGCFKLSDAEMKAAADARKVTFNEQRRVLDIIKPTAIAPFAADFCWLDERLFHCNWANRTTPKLFTAFANGEFPETEVVLLLPSDVWTKSGGVRKNHPGVDWDDMLGEIRKLQQRFRPKLEAIQTWLRDSDFSDMEARTRQRTAITQQRITQDWVNFSARFRFQIEGPNSGFSYVLKADPATGVSFDWDDRGAVDQTLHVDEIDWAAILDGKLTSHTIQWVAKAVQHVAYRIDMGRFWYWREYHEDLDGSRSQILLDGSQFPTVRQHVRPRHASFPMPGEWD